MPTDPSSPAPTALEDALRKSEARYRFLAETIPVQVWTARPDSMLDYVSTRAVTELSAALTAASSSGSGPTPTSPSSATSSDASRRCSTRWQRRLARPRPRSRRCARRASRASAPRTTSIASRSTSAARAAAAAASAARRRRAGRAPRAHVVRLRIKPSCVVEATSLPSRVNTRPRARPRPPCAAGLSRA